MSNNDDLIRESDNSRVPAQIVSVLPMGLNITSAVMVDERVDIPANTTLNEKLEIEVNNSLGLKNGRDFKLRYFGVGIRGSQVTGIHPITQTETRHTNQHQPSDQAVFYQLPLCARPLNDDLTEQERERYRARTVMNKDGIDYALYWLSKMGVSEFTPKTKRVVRSPETGNEVPTDYVYRPESINPTPVKLNNDGSVPLSNAYLTSTATLDLSLNGSDLEELRNVCRILFKDPSLAAISEYAIFYGIETTTEGPGPGGTRFRYKELLSMVAAYLVTERHARDANANGDIVLKFDLSAGYPLLLDE